MSPIQPVVDSDSEASWTIARQISGLLGPIPPALIDALKALWKSHTEAKQAETQVPINDDCFRFTRILDRTPKLRTPLCTAAGALYSDRFQSSPEQADAKTLLNVLQPGMFAVLLGQLYFHRRVSKLRTEDDWTRLTKDLAINTELGYVVGNTSPALGAAEGMLMGGIRQLALAALLVKNPENFAKYRRTAGRKFDVELERQMYGCDHAQIAAYFIFDMGFRKDMLEVAQAVRKFGRQVANLPPQLQVWRAAIAFIDFLKAGICPPPEPSLAQQLQITAAPSFEVLKAKHTQLQDNGSSFTWLLRSGGETAE